MGKHAVPFLVTWALRHFNYWNYYGENLIVNPSLPFVISPFPIKLFPESLFSSKKTKTKTKQKPKLPCLSESSPSSICAEGWEDRAGGLRGCRVQCPTVHTHCRHPATPSWVLTGAALSLGPLRQPAGGLAFIYYLEELGGPFLPSYGVSPRGMDLNLKVVQAVRGRPWAPMHALPLYPALFPPIHRPSLDLGF